MSLEHRLNRFWRLLAEGEDQAVLAEFADMDFMEMDAPGADELYYVWARALWNDGRLEHGIRIMEALVERRSDSAAAHRQLANMYDENEDFVSAGAHYEKAAAIAPMDTAILVDWGVQLCREGRFDEALEKLEKAGQIGADDDNYHLYRAIALENVDDLETAADVYERYLERGWRDPYAIGRLGVVYSELGRYEEAESLLREAHELEPEEGDHIYNLAICLKRDERLEEAEDIARQLVSVDPGNAQNWGLLGDIRMDLGDSDSARLHYNQALELNPRESYSLSGLAWIHFNSGRVDDAVRAANKALGCDPGNISALDLLRHTRPACDQLERYNVDLRVETEDNLRFFKSMECLAHDEKEAIQFVNSLQMIFPRETWWEIESVERLETVFNERPGVCWIPNHEQIED